MGSPEDPRIRRWREREEERLARVGEPVPEPVATQPSYDRKVFLPGVGQQTGRVWTDPVIVISVFLLAVELAIFALGTWQVARSETG